MLHLFIINSFVVAGAVNSLVVFYKNRGRGTDFYLYVFFFEIIKCSSFPMYDSYVKWLILVTNHEIAMVCLNSFSLALEICLIVSSYLRHNKSFKFLACTLSHPSPLFSSRSSVV